MQTSKAVIGSFINFVNQLCVGAFVMCWSCVGVGYDYLIHKSPIKTFQPLNLIFSIGVE